VFWQPSAAFLEGKMTADDAAAAIAGTYLTLVEAWDRSRRV
jgi:myo-inositol catabolism protein IolC